MASRMQHRAQEVDTYEAMMAFETFATLELEAAEDFKERKEGKQMKGKNLLLLL